jgi:putative ABC transport system permease protein
VSGSESKKLYHSQQEATMSVIWNKVWSDLWHHKVRTLLAVVSIAAGVFALGAIFGMIDQLIPNLNRVHASIEPAHLTMFLDDRIDQTTADRLKSIDGVAGVEPLNVVIISILASAMPARSATTISVRESLAYA